MSRKKIGIVLLLATVMLVAVSGAMILSSSNKPAQVYAGSYPQALEFYEEVELIEDFTVAEIVSEYTSSNISEQFSMKEQMSASLMIESAQITSSQLTPTTLNALKDAMRRDYFFIGSQRHYIQNYFRDFHRRSRTDGRVAIRYPDAVRGTRGVLTFNSPDPITNFIPRNVFVELRTAGVFTLIGDEWGVIIDTIILGDNRHFVVQVVDINMSDNIEVNDPNNHLNREDLFHVELWPLFEVEFVWITTTRGFIPVEMIANSGSIDLSRRSTHHRFRHSAFDFTVNGSQVNNLFSMPLLFEGTSQNRPFFTHSFDNRNRNFVSNVSITSRLANAQDANPEHGTYNVIHDFGAFFHGQDLFGRVYNSSNFSFSGSSSVSYRGIVEFAAGHIPLIGNFLSWGAFAWDVIGNVRYLQNANRDLRNSSNSNDESEHFSFGTSNRVLHIERNENRKVKEATARFSDQNAMLTLFPTRGFESRILSRFFIAHHHDRDGHFWGQRIRTEISFDVQRYQNRENVGVARGTREQIIREGYPRQIVADEQVRVYNYHQNTSRFRLQVPREGLFTFNFVNPNHVNKFRNFQPQMRLRAGSHYFDLEYLHNGASISYLTVERVSEIFTLEFHSNGGIGTTPSIFHENNSPLPEIVASELPTKQGFIFDGFWTTTDFGGWSIVNYDGTRAFCTPWSPFGRDFVIDSIVTIHARWRPEGAVLVTVMFTHLENILGGGVLGDLYNMLILDGEMPTLVLQKWLTPSQGLDWNGNTLAAGVQECMWTLFELFPTLQDMYHIYGGNGEKSYLYFAAINIFNCHEFIFVVEENEWGAEIFDWVFYYICGSISGLLPIHGEGGFSILWRVDIV